MLKERIENEIKKQYGMDVTAEFVTVKKNNGVELKGYCIKRENDRVSPTFYLQDDESDDDAVSRIVKMFGDELVKTESDTVRNKIDEISDMLDDADKIYGNVIPTLVSNKNVSDLDEQGIYHESYLDMEVIYRLTFNNIGLGIASTKMSNALIEKSNVDINVMKEKAMCNIKGGTVINKISEILPVPDSGMYVVGNDKGIYGASSMMCEDTLMEMHDRTGSDTIFILPSSVHEIIIVGDNILDDCKSEEDRIKELKSMVACINATEVRPDEVLTNSVYIHRRDGRMEVA